VTCKVGGDTVPAKNSKYKPDETPTLIEQCAREGMTKYEIAAKLGIHRRSRLLSPSRRTAVVQPQPCRSNLLSK